MKANLQLFILGLGVSGAMTLCPTAARADLEVTASVNIRATTEFHAPLAPYGTWIEVGSYGRCWRPTGIAVGWRPYCEGTWVWTDCGWYWQTDEAWGWACYHYGSWFEMPEYGWVWVPDVVWAPAWVTWRYGGGYCGWSPLPPHGVVVAPAAFVFVETHRFHEPVHRSRVIVNNTTIINRTTVIGGPTREDRNISGQRAQKVVVNSGPDIAEVSKATGKKANAVPIREMARRADPPEKVVRQINQVQAQKIQRAQTTSPQNEQQPKAPTINATPGQTTAPAPATETPAPTPAPKPQPSPQTKPEVNSVPAPAPVRPSRQPGPPQQQPGAVPPVERPAPPPTAPPTYQQQPQPPSPYPSQQKPQAPPPRGKAKGHEKPE